MRPQSPIITGFPIEWVGSYGGDISRSGTAKMRLNASTGNLEISVNGGAYAVITTPLVSAALANSTLAAPKIVTYQETITYTQFTDGGAASGTYNLATSIPAGAVYLQTLYTAITGFTGDTSAVAILGDGTDTDRYMTGTPSVFTTAAAGVSAGAPSGTAFHSAAKTPVLTVTSATDWGAVVAGSVTVTLFYYAAS